MKVCSELYFAVKHPDLRQVVANFHMNLSYLRFLCLKRELADLLLPYVIYVYQIDLMNHSFAIPSLVYQYNF